MNLLLMRACGYYHYYYYYNIVNNTLYHSVVKNGAVRVGWHNALQDLPAKHPRVVKIKRSIKYRYLQFLTCSTSIAQSSKFIIIGPGGMHGVQCSENICQKRLARERKC